MTFGSVDHPSLLARLELPSGPCRVVIDTDTNNEIDDQIAVAYALLSDRLHVEAIYAAPYDTEPPGHGPGRGMELSYEELERVLERMPMDYAGDVRKGAESFMSAPDEPVDSPAARNLAARALREGESKLYVLALGAPINVASATLMEPRIVDRIVVVPLGGSPHDWPGFDDYNFCQDLDATRVLFDSGVGLVHIPAYGVSETLATTEPELTRYLVGRGVIGDYLYEIYRGYVPDEVGKSNPIWDMVNVAYLVDPSWVTTHLVTSPIKDRAQDLQLRQESPPNPGRELDRPRRDLPRLFREAPVSYLVKVTPGSQVWNGSGAPPELLYTTRYGSSACDSRRHLSDRLSRTQEKP